MSEDCNYYHHIAQMIKSCDLENYLSLEVNISSDALKSILRRGKVYYHPMPEEPFGISIVEAMSAGLVPIVPEIGGQTDFVPRKYRYSTLAEAAMKISLALITSQEERSTLSQNVASFSKGNYITRIQKVVGSLLEEPKIKLDVPEASTISPSPLPSLLQPKFPIQQKFLDMKNKK
jgi:glycosyltransferase involved in cell wall biosynthesis